MAGKGQPKEILKPFKPGQSGNPKGRPKLPDLKEAIAKLLSEGENGKSGLYEILKALYNRALKGDVRAAQELMDRGFGKSQQSIDHTSLGEPITKFTYEIIKSDRRKDTGDGNI